MENETAELYLIIEVPKYTVTNINYSGNVNSKYLLYMKVFNKIYTILNQSSKFITSNDCLSSFYLKLGGIRNFF